MRQIFRNHPIATVIRNYVNKKSGKVTDSRNEIQRRFYGLDWKDQKKILIGFLEAGKTDRDWAYSQLLNFWDASFEPKVLELWENYHESKCSWVIIRHCSITYVMEHVEELSADERNYYFICRRMVEHDEFTFDRNRLSGKDYVAAMYHAGRAIPKHVATDILYREVSKWCLCNSPVYLMRDYATSSRKELFSVVNISDVSTILYYLKKMQQGGICNEFIAWDGKMATVIRDSDEMAELNNMICSDWEYKERIAAIAQKYLYLALPSQYKPVGDDAFERKIEEKRALYDSYMSYCENTGLPADISDEAPF